MHRFGRRIISVHVDSGRATETFDAHENLLIKHSKFFRAAPPGEWTESTKRTVSLKEDNAEDFALFYDFLYTGQVFGS